MDVHWQGLLLQTYLFQTTSSELIYNQAKSDSYCSMENMQDDIYTFIKSIENGLIDIYNEKELIMDLRSGMESSTLQNRYYRTAYDIATENFQTSDGVVSLYIYDKSTGSSVHTGGGDTRNIINLQIFMIRYLMIMQRK